MRKEITKNKYWVYEVAINETFQRDDGQESTWCGIGKLRADPQHRKGPKGSRWVTWPSLEEMQEDLQAVIDLMNEETDWQEEDIPF